jgi:hypothetical protein
MCFEAIFSEKKKAQRGDQEHSKDGDMESVSSNHLWVAGVVSIITILD